jgi:hypothetical protein
MLTPAWILDIFAALMLVVAAVSAARLVAARPWRHGSLFTDTDVAHLLMAIAMAGMLASSLTTLPDTAWEVIFALMTAWFAVRVIVDARASGARALAGGHCAPHLVHSAAMLYMFAAIAVPAASASAGMSGMGGGSAAQTLRYPTLAFVFALILVGYGIWDLDQLSGRRYSTTPARVPLTTRPAAAVPALAGAHTVTAAFAAPQPGGPPPDTAIRTGFAAADHAVPPQDPAARLVTGRLLLSPATTVGCRVVMGVTMAFMLFIMI